MPPKHIVNIYLTIITKTITMKKVLLIFAIAFISIVNVKGQATSQLNFGLVGVCYDIPVTEDIAISPSAGTNLSLDWLTLGVKANYYFDNIFKLPEAWDFYAGANAGYAILIGNGVTGSSGFDMGLQVGGRWFWNEKFGLYLELGGGHTSGGTAGLGITMKL